MFDENPENIDRLFKEQYEQVEVRFNAEHWNQLRNTLVATGAAVAVASTQQTIWARIARFLRNQKNMLIIATTTTFVFVAAILVMRDKEPQNIPPANPAILSPKSLTHELITPADSLNIEQHHYADSLKTTTNTHSFGRLDTLITPILIPMDTLDSLKVDSLDGFIFW